MRKLTFLFTFLLFVALQASAQMQITGKVTNAESGDPIPGASVVVKSQTTIGTTTDMDGNYSLDGIPSDAETLVFSFVGMQEKEIAINGRTTINVELAPAVTEMEEVIVSGVASGTKKKNMTVSVDKISADDLAQAPANNAISSLQGKMSGVNVTNAIGQPGSGSTVQIRGATNLIGSQEPLIMVDGAIYQGNLEDIGVDDIQDIEVVKGASASALYGSKAGNGVIVIRTKRGANQNVGETRVNIRNEFGYSTVQNYIDLATHHRYELKDPNNPGDTYTNYAGVTYPDGYQHGSHPDISGSRIESTDHYVDNPYAFTNDLQKQFFKDGTNYTNYVGVSRRAENSNFHVSFENNKQSGIVKETSGYTRQTLRTNVDFFLTDDLKLSASNMFTKSESKSPGGVNLFNGGAFFDVLFNLPDIDLNWENEQDGSPYDLDASHWNGQETNPLYQVANIDDRTTENTILGSYRANYTIIEPLTIEVKYAYDRRTSNQRIVEPYDFLVKGAAKGVLNKSKGNLEKFNSFSLNQQLQATAHFNKQFGDWTTKGKLSYLYEDEEYQEFYVNGSEFAVSGTPTLEAVSGSKTTTSQKEVVRAANYFGIGNIDYQDTYLADFMYRLDGSSKFGKNERWNPYYRVSAAWRITQDFDIPGIQEWKIRGAIGTSGQRPGYAAQYETYDVTSGGNYSKQTLGNPDLKPSTTTEQEIATNLSFLDRFNLEASYSISITEDAFINEPLPAYKGWPSKWVNAASVESNSFELSLNSKIIQTNDFSWTANANFSRIRAKITELDVPPRLVGTEAQESQAFYLRADETFGIIYGQELLTSMDQLTENHEFGANPENYEINEDGYVIPAGSAGTVDESPLVLLNEEGQPKKVQIGNTNPDFRLGLSTTLNYKGFTFYALLDWKQGGDVYNRTRQWLYRDLRHADVDQAGKPADKKKAYDYYKGLYNTNLITSEFVDDASYLKIRELSLSYTFDEDQLSNLGGGFIKGIKLSLIGRNLFTFTDYPGYDPEVAMPDYGDAGTPGSSYYKYDAYQYPTYSEFTGSLTLTF